MQLIKLNPPGDQPWCDDMKTCPAIFVDAESDHAVVQGNLLVDSTVMLPDGEVRVLVPKALLRSLAAQLARI